MIHAPPSLDEVFQLTPLALAPGQQLALPLPHDSRHHPGRRSDASDLASMLDLPGRRGEPGRHDLSVLVRRD